MFNGQCRHTTLPTQQGVLQQVASNAGVGLKQAAEPVLEPASFHVQLRQRARGVLLRDLVPGQLAIPTRPPPTTAAVSTTLPQHAQLPRTCPQGSSWRPHNAPSRDPRCEAPPERLSPPRSCACPLLAPRSVACPDHQRAITHATSAEAAAKAIKRRGCLPGLSAAGLAGGPPCGKARTRHTGGRRCRWPFGVRCRSHPCGPPAGRTVAGTCVAARRRCADR